MCDALTFISSEDQIDVCQGFIDDWREEVRNNLFDDEDDEIAASPREKRREAAMQKLTLMNITTRNSRNQLSRQLHRPSGLQNN